MKASTDDSKALGSFRAGLAASSSDGLVSTAVALARIGRGCGPYFRQGVRSTFASLGELRDVRLAKRARKAEASRILDRAANSKLTKRLCSVFIYSAVVVSVLWGSSSVLASVRLNGASSSSAPKRMDMVQALEVQDSVERLLRAFASNRQEYLSLSSALNPQAARFCASFFSRLDLREAPLVESSFPGSDGSFLEAKVQFKGRRPVYFMFRKSPGAPGLRFAGLRPDLR